MMSVSRVCPLLADPATYIPDTLDLRTDSDARAYWINCLCDLSKKFASQAAKSQSQDETAQGRSSQYVKTYINELQKIEADNKSNFSLEHLSIRHLLDLNESYLRLHGFVDPWKEQKQIENSLAIKSLTNRLKEIDQLDNRERWNELVKGLLAGNLFDWGAQVVSQILENDASFGLKEAQQCIQKRPWLIDNLDEWLQRIEGDSHKCATVFVDNSGVDFILGVLPLARELLRRNTRVLLCANSVPSLNDITEPELREVLRKCSEHCEIIRRAVDDHNLLVYGNGQEGPCLDMRSLNAELCSAIETNQTDLLIIEGMGRALHTNLNAKFNCETLKLAVIKNKWLANRLGGDMFSVLCKYERI